MNAYLYPVETALIQFPLIALAITIPYMLYNYHKYGSISKFRSLILFSLILYLQCAYYLVILPLPDPDKVAQMNGHTMQLIPFNFIYEFFAKSSFSLADPISILQAIRESYFLQPLFNMVLTIPFGAYLSYYFQKDLKKTIILTFFLSLFFELTQLSGLYGIYTRPYRLFDVDDLMLNTIGGIIGYLTGTKIFAKIFPDRKEIDAENIKKSEYVSYTRRIFALIIDIFIINVVLSILYPITKIDANSPYTYHFILLTYFVLMPIFFKGQTLGKKFVRLKIVKENESTPFIISLLIRYVPILILSLYFNLMNELLPKIYDQRFIILSYAVICGLIFIDVIYSMIKKKKSLLYERLSKTKYMSLIKSNEENEII